VKKLALLIIFFLTACAQGSADNLHTKTPADYGKTLNPTSEILEWKPVIEKINGVKMVLVPAGCFMMGSTDEELQVAVRLCREVRGESGFCEKSIYRDEQPVHRQCFDQPFWLDMYEVTNADYGSLGTWKGNDNPRDMVTWADAVAHCKSRGGYLPSEAEWEYAARGPEGLWFPWGKKFDSSRVNSCDGDCELNLIGHQTDDGYPTIAPVGSFPEGTSWVGAMDLAGNLWEWTMDPYGDYPFGDLDYFDNADQSRRVLRGGAWFHVGADYMRSAARYAVSIDYADKVVGFRCAHPYWESP
jgi:formylglycine-generating enzyme required for sulfatase activity